MTVVFFIDLWADATDAKDLDQLYRGTVVPAALARPEVRSVHLYTPDTRALPFGNDENPPDVTLELAVDTIADIDAVFAGPGGAEFLPVPDGCRATHDVFERLTYPVAEDSDPADRRAPISFGVRYYPPVSDEKTFVDHYLAHHPALLARLPRIRNVLCYTPLAGAAPIAIPRSGCIVGNEVVFDTMADLAAALQSDALEDVLADSRANPVDRGPGTHFAFHRDDYFAP